MDTNHLTETKVSKSNNGKGKSFTYSTVIPKVIVNKFGLDKGRKLYWDIDSDNILITPELPEETSIQAGLDILQDMLLNNNQAYSLTYSSIRTHLSKKDISKEEKVNNILQVYDNTYVDDKEPFKKVVLYLLDYPLGYPDQYEILNKVYEEITKE